MKFININYFYAHTVNANVLVHISKKSKKKFQQLS